MIQEFTNEQFGTVRTTIIDGDIHFVVADVCKALDIKSSYDVAKRLDDDELKQVDLNEPTNGVTNRPVNNGGNAGATYGWIKNVVNVVNEAGLYRLIFMSRKPDAKKFQRWIFHQVIPKIRESGFYATPATVDKILSDPDVLIRILQEIKSQRNTIQDQEHTIISQREHLRQLNRQLDDLAPKAELYDQLLNAEGTYTATDIAKDYGMSAIAFNKLLQDMGIQYKLGGRWYLMQAYANLGWAQSRTTPYVDVHTGKTHFKVDMVWTQKGRMGLYNLLKAVGRVPTYER